MPSKSVSSYAPAAVRTEPSSPVQTVSSASADWPTCTFSVQLDPPKDTRSPDTTSVSPPRPFSVRSPSAGALRSRQKTLVDQNGKSRSR